MSTQTPSCGSSETTRKATSFITDDFYKYGQVPHLPKISEAFLQWFVGFWEGDGSLWTSYEESAFTKNRLSLSIAQKEKTIITTIANTFGFGDVSTWKVNGATYWRWTVESKNGLERLVFLFSGNLILPKRQNQFLQWIAIGQQKGMFQLPFDPSKPWMAKISFDNAWLSGFIDAEGCFSARCRDQVGRKIFLDQKMSLTQKDVLEGERLVFQKILGLFESNARVSTFKNRDSISNFIRIELGSLKSHQLISNYLFKYKLRTVKHISFHRWWRVYLYRVEGWHPSEKSIKKIRRLVKAINVHRKQSYI
jgi:LAGLIDADG endonuclease